MNENPIESTPRASGEELRGIASLPLLVRCGNWFFRYRDFAFPLVFVVLAVLTRPAFPLGNPYLDYVVDALGLLVALGGQILRAAVIGLAYIRRGGKDKQIYASELVQEGFLPSLEPRFQGAPSRQRAGKDSFDSPIPRARSSGCRMSALTARFRNLVDGHSTREMPL